MIRTATSLLLLLAGCSSQSAGQSTGVAAQPDAAGSGLPDGALVYTGELPTCTVPDGASRTFLACADCFEPEGDVCSVGGADNATDCQSCGACVMACEPNEYALVNVPMGQTLPKGCGAALPVMRNYLENAAIEGSGFTITCCPCE